MNIIKPFSLLLGVAVAFAIMGNQAFSEPETSAEAPAPVVRTTAEITGVDQAKITIMQRPPLDAVKDTPVGQLKNPFNADNKELVELGRKRYLGASCNGCHGGSGGGGMCPPLSNEVWVYGSDDDTLFRLVSLGSVELTAQTGLSRKGRENVVGPMPPHGTIVKTEEDLWKIITFIRSNYRGDPAKKTW
ncbi:c-type cytochrome [Methylophilus sp. 14]|uniref:c-type cytochrome n=1 Tax=Methylophilus sp. 14 TaxID=2781019 RepID=UPI0034CD142A